jgi:hypothetical protein
MKLSKILAILAAAALALMAFADTASATTLEVGGTAKNEAVAWRWSVVGFVKVFEDTGGFWANSCSVSNVQGTTASPFTATRVGGPVSAMTFESCTEDAVEKVVVDAAGSIEVESISGTTNATLFSKNLKVTTPSPFGKLTCTTSSTGTDIGKVTGVSSGNARVDINAALNCGSITARWVALYEWTSPFGFGIRP